MRYRVVYSRQAARSLKKLDPSVRTKIAEGILERAKFPHVLPDKLRGDLKGLYKIKFRSLGLRVIYQVKDFEIEVHVIAIGKRDRGEVYKSLT